MRQQTHSIRLRSQYKKKRNNYNRKFSKCFLSFSCFGMQFLFLSFFFLLLLFLYIMIALSLLVWTIKSLRQFIRMVMNEKSHLILLLMVMTFFFEIFYDMPYLASNRIPCYWVQFLFIISLSILKWMIPNTQFDWKLERSGGVKSNANYYFFYFFFQFLQWIRPFLILAPFFFSFIWNACILCEFFPQFRLSFI